MKFNSIRIDGDTVYVSLVGPQTPAIATDMLAHFKRAVEQVRAKHSKVYVLVDLSGVILQDVGTDARLSIKEAFGVPFYRLAAIGHSHMMEVAMYLMKAGGADKRAQYFTSRKAAERWLRADMKEQSDRLSNSVLAAGLLTMLIGLVTLVGWYAHHPGLMTWLTYANQICPIDSVGLMVLGAIIAGIWARKRLLVFAGLVGLVLLGVIGAFQNPVATWIFGERLWTEGAWTSGVDAITVSYISVVVAVLLLQSKWAYARNVVRVLMGTVNILALLSIYDQLYDQDFIFNLVGRTAMPLSLAIGFLVISILLLMAVGKRSLDGLRLRVGPLGWSVVAAIILVQVGTCVSWGQSVGRNRDDADRNMQSLETGVGQLLLDRSRAYTDALHGFQGLFRSSDFVGPDEFEAYFEAVQLGKNYPGLRSIVYNSRVPDSSLKSFTANQQKAFATAQQPSTFTVKKPSNLPVHYIVTYLAGTNNSAAIGNDLSADASRRLTYEKAENTNSIVSSGTVQLAASASEPAGKGFFLAVPVRNESGAQSGARAGEYTGIVAAVFNYDKFFKAVFSVDDLLEGANLAIYDDKTGDMLYGKKDAGVVEDVTRNFTVPFADQEWKLTLTAPTYYGVNVNQQRMPLGIFLSGQLLTLMLICLFVVLWRSRRNALALADTITADLQQERNRAISLQQKDDAILSSIGDAVFAIDTEGRVTLFNPAAEKVSGYDSAEVVGKPYGEFLKFFYSKDDLPNHDFIDEAQSGKLTSMKGHTYLVHKNGQHVAVADSAAPIRGADGAQIGSIVVFRDVSQEEELDRAKSEFVSVASHQLRTPLSAINWYAEMLLDEDSGKLTVDQREYAQEIFDGNQRMVELVNALLDVSRLDVGKIKSEPEPTDLPVLADSVLKESMPALRIKKQKLIDEIDHTLPVISTDPKMLRMVLQNLVSNAVKYTPEKGSVTVAVRKATAGEVKQAKLKKAGQYLIIKVADTGYGIPKAQQRNIFSKMFRADNVRKMAVEGTGLGLYIVKEVASKLGGTVWFESVEGKGTTFHTLVPLIVADKSERDKIKKSS